MPWCPKCGTEHREGFSHCADCQAALVDTPPKAKDQDLQYARIEEVLLTVAADEMEFTRIESLMAEAGIPVLKKHRGSGEYLELYMGQSPYGIEVYVPSDAHERAQALLSGDESVDEASAPVDIPTVLEPNEEQELQYYLNAVNQDMYRRKKVIATVILFGMASGILWSVFSILKELFKQ